MLSRYDSASTEAAARGVDPRESPQVHQAHRQAHAAVMRAYRELRPEVKSHLSGHWSGDVPHGEEPPEPIYSGQTVEIPYLKHLDEFENPYRIGQTVSGGRNQLPTTKKVVQADPLPPAALKAVLDRLTECRVELGLGAQIDAGLKEWGYMQMDFGLSEQAGLPVPCMGHTIDLDTPLHKMFLRRLSKGRDMKVIITARNAATGTGKTTLAFWLAHQWQSIWRRDEWQADDQATLDPSEFLSMYQEHEPGTCLIMDEAEGLDARRSMAQENVDFSHHWMKMRVRQVVSILTLPSATALDSRLQELADVWIEVENRGTATVHSLATNSYSQNLMTKKQHTISWPDVSEHPQMQRLDELKQQHIDESAEEEETIDPEEAKIQEKKNTAQRLRDSGMSAREVGDLVDRSHTWVLDNTEAPSEPQEAVSND
jgi:hypothetical protein